MPRRRGGGREHGGRPRRARPDGGLSRGERALFDSLVVEALETIPEPFRSRLENVAIVAEEEPSRALLESLGMGPEDTLFGLYDGIPLTERGDWYNLVQPDRIILFRRPIMAACGSLEEIREEVRRTVVHEIAHFYGMSDEDLERMGLY